MFLLLKISLFVGFELLLYDVVFVVFGVVVDFFYILIDVKVEGFGVDNLDDVLVGCDIVFILVGMLCKLGMDCVDFFNVNVGIIKILVEGIVKNCFKVLVGIIINLVNGIVLIVVEVFKKVGIYDVGCVFGIIIFDVICLEVFVVEFKGLSVIDVKVLVIGGYLGIIIFFFLF